MTEITVLTLNLWGIFNSKMREARMIAFAQKVGHYDVILLQEQFTDDDWALIHRHLPAEVRSSRYAQRFPSSFYGSGCAVFSRFPITSALFFTYPLQGYPEMILHGDFFANKGAACIRLQVPVVGGGAGSTAQTEELVVYTTHLVAVYERISALRGPAEERYHAIRLSQAISLADFVAQTSKPDDAIIVGGDFNCGQDSLEVKTFLAILARRGFHLHSTLPSPRAVRSVGGRTLAEALHTFSDRNPFNVSKTSYFKLLGMQADIPAQIDHLIISANRLRVENYRDCPDVPADYPLFARPVPATTTTTSAGDGAEHQPASSTTTPCAVVVMQDCHVVSRPEEAHVVEQLLQRVVAMRGGVETSKAPTLCPISDHYGVAAKLSLRRGATTTTTTPGVEVATADTAVLAQASAVLNAFTDKLDRDTRISMYMAGISSALLLCHVGMLAHHARQTTRVGADVLQLLYLEGRQAGNAEVLTVGDVSRQVATKALRATSAATRWVVSTAKSIAAPPSASNNNNNNHHLAAPVQPLPLAEVVPHIAHEAQTQVVEELPNFLGTATQLMQKPFSLQPAIYTFNVVAAAIVSITSLAVGLIQRRGNSAIAQEQARRVREM